MTATIQQQQHMEQITKANSDTAKEEATNWMNTQIEQLERSISEVKSYKKIMEEQETMQGQANYIEYTVNHLQQSLRLSEGVRVAGRLQAAYAEQVMLNMLSK